MEALWTSRTPLPDRGTRAILIASKDGAKSFGDTLASVEGQGDVYVVSDGSTDDTARVARQYGATVLELSKNVGKPAAIYRLFHTLNLVSYDYIAIVDDDTLPTPGYMDSCISKFDKDTAIVVGRTVSRRDQDRKWNPWMAARAFSYWKYQATIRRGQDVFNALNCISGSNSVYRAQLLNEVLVERTPYIVDDTMWTLETHRRGLGSIRYQPDATAYVQDPDTMRSWYKQNLRWMWGTFQGVRGHKVARQRSWFDFWYVMLMLDWAFYVFAVPALMVGLMLTFNPLAIMAGVMVGYTLWLAVAAAALRHWRLLLLAPFMFFYDYLSRVNFVHALVLAIKQPVVRTASGSPPPDSRRYTMTMLPMTGVASTPLAAVGLFMTFVGWVATRLGRSK